jgi:hypothetical protein
LAINAMVALLFGGVLSAPILDPTPFRYNSDIRIRTEESRDGFQHPEVVTGSIGR